MADCHEYLGIMCLFDRKMHKKTKLHFKPQIKQHQHKV